MQESMSLKYGGVAQFDGYPINFMNGYRGTSLIRNRAAESGVWQVGTVREGDVPDLPERPHSQLVLLNQPTSAPPHTTLRCRNVQWFRGGLASEAHRLLYHSLPLSLFLSLSHTHSLSHTLSSLSLTHAHTHRLVQFAKEMCLIFPNAQRINRGAYTTKEVPPAPSSGDTTPCRMTGVTLHGVVFPDPPTPAFTQRLPFVHGQRGCLPPPPSRPLVQQLPAEDIIFVELMKSDRKLKASREGSKGRNCGN